MSWNEMSPDEKSHHIVHNVFLGFIRMLLACAYTLAMAGLLMAAVFWLVPIVAPMWPDIHPLATTAILTFIGASVFYYIICKPALWIAGSKRDVLNPQDWRDIGLAPKLRHELPPAQSVPRYARPRYPTVTCPYCGTINSHSAHYCGEGQVRGCGSKL